MELVVLFNTESFNKDDVTKAPITKDSVIQHIEFDPSKRYQLKS